MDYTRPLLKHAILIFFSHQTQLMCIHLVALDSTYVYSFGSLPIHQNLGLYLKKKTFSFMLNLTPEIEKTQNALFGGVFMGAPYPGRLTQKLPCQCCHRTVKEHQQTAPDSGKPKIVLDFTKKRLRKKSSSSSRHTFTNLEDFLRLCFDF